MILFWLLYICSFLFLLLAFCSFFLSYFTFCHLFAVVLALHFVRSSCYLTFCTFLFLHCSLLFLSCFPFCLLFLLLYILIFLFVALFFLSIFISEWWMLLRTLTPPQINYQKSVKYQNWELNSHQLQNKLLMVSSIM